MENGHCFHPLSHIAHPVVLAVDDQPRMVQLLKAALTPHGYEVVTATSGPEALERIELRQPDVILMDAIMPGMDGFEVCRILKGIPETHDIPVLFVSGICDHASIMAGFKAGGVDFVSKPYNKAELLARVATHVHLHRERQRSAQQATEQSRILKSMGLEWQRSLERLSMVAERLHVAADDGKWGIVRPLATKAYEQADHTLQAMTRFLDEFTGPMDGSSSESLIDSDHLKEMVSRWYVSARRKRVEFAIQAPKNPVPIFGDHESISQIVEAVMDNAIQFSPGEGTLSVNIQTIPRGVSLTVEDEGPGFPKRYMAHMFQPYLKDPAGSVQQLGLGLVAARRAADRCNATLQLTNLPKRGASVQVEFSSTRKPAVRKADGSASDLSLNGEAKLV